MTGHIHDFIGIGLGPFNLGLACLTEPIDLDGLFLEARDEITWHPGMLLDDATLQVPFLADLVTMADPTSTYSYLAFLKGTGRLYPFYIRESFYPLRREYSDYCRWAADRLSNVRFGCPVSTVEHDGEAYVVTTNSERHRARRLVLGVGTRPVVPDALAGVDGAQALHSADYLGHRDTLLTLDSITVVGSGQSAAEVYADLLSAAPDHRYALNWVTRSPRFFPMEYTKLTLEMTSPEYAAYFRSLPSDTRTRLNRAQRSLHKGISAKLVDRIYDLQYELRATGRSPELTMVTGTEVVGARRDGSSYQLDLHHLDTDESFGLRTEGLVMATGYAPRVPDFLDPVRHRIAWDEQGRYEVSATYATDRTGDEIFVQNADEHVHGLIAPDLGMGAYRNSVIIAAMTGREVYPLEKRIATQHFGVPDHLKAAR
ncbi:MAG: SidA/IucD/PvdA family monooxygenase [Nocardioides sp.]|nr:SidA/IucD/PvdA family monooxygenase [Nocardioides sp.]